LVAKSLVKQIRSGRKVFKLLKFVETHKEFVYLVEGFKMDEFKDMAKSLYYERKFSDRNFPVIDHAMKLVIKFSSYF